MFRRKNKEDKHNTKTCGCSDCTLIRLERDEKRLERLKRARDRAKQYTCLLCEQGLFLPSVKETHDENKRRLIREDE